MVFCRDLFLSILTFFYNFRQINCLLVEIVGKHWFFYKRKHFNTKRYLFSGKFAPHLSELHANKISQQNK